MFALFVWTLQLLYCWSKTNLKVAPFCLTQALYRGQTLFLLYGMKDFPRVTILFSYLFAYDEVFVPFVQFTCQAEGVSLDEYHIGKVRLHTQSPKI